MDTNVLYANCLCSCYLKFYFPLLIIVYIIDHYEFVAMPVRIITAFLRAVIPMGEEELS